MHSSPTVFHVPWIQALLKEAHEVEVKKQKAEEKIEKQLAINKEDTATEVHMFIPASLLHPVSS